GVGEDSMNAFDRCSLSSAKRSVADEAPSRRGALHEVAGRRGLRTIHDYAGLERLDRHDCGHAFFAPTDDLILDSEEEILAYMRSGAAGVVLPLGSERERDTFPVIIEYLKRLG